MCQEQTGQNKIMLISLVFDPQSGSQAAFLIQFIVVSVICHVKLCCFQTCYKYFINIQRDILESLVKLGACRELMALAEHPFSQCIAAEKTWLLCLLCN